MLDSWSHIKKQKQQQPKQTRKTKQKNYKCTGMNN